MVYLPLKVWCEPGGALVPKLPVWSNALSETRIGEEAKPPLDVHCQHCGKIQQAADDIFGDRDKVEITCPACGKAFQVVNPKLMTLRVEVTRRNAPSITEDVSPEGRMLRLPEDQEISLKVLEGAEQGTVYPVTKPRITIGRANADVNIDDRMASRLHCALEVSDDGVILRDLGSTNGTLVNNKPIEMARLSSESTFRVGTHLFQIVIAPKGHEKNRAL